MDQHLAPGVTASAVASPSLRRPVPPPPGVTASPALGRRPVPSPPVGVAAAAQAVDGDSAATSAGSRTSGGRQPRFRCHERVGCYSQAVFFFFFFSLVFEVLASVRRRSKLEVLLILLAHRQALRVLHLPPDFLLPFVRRPARLALLCRLRHQGVCVLLRLLRLLPLQRRKR